MSIIVLLHHPFFLLFAFWLSVLAVWRFGMRQGRTMGLILLGVGIAAWFGSAVIARGYAVFLIAGVFGLITLPLAAVGIGLVVGGALNWVERSSRRSVSTAVAVAIGALQVVAYDIRMHSVLDESTKASARRAEFATRTFEAAFGSTRVLLPAAPTIDVHYRAPKWSGVTSRFRSAQHDFTRDPATGEPIPIEIREIRVNSIHPECDSVERESRHCLAHISSLRLATWCESREDVQGTPWCDRPRHVLVFQLASKHSRRTVGQRDHPLWPEADLPALGTDLSGKPIRLRCHHRSFEHQGDEGGCRADVAVRNDVLVEIQLYDVTLDAAPVEGRKMVEHAVDLWREMSVQSRPAIRP